VIVRGTAQKPNRNFRLFAGADIYNSRFSALGTFQEHVRELGTYFRPGATLREWAQMFPKDAANVRLDHQFTLPYATMQLLLRYSKCTPACLCYSRASTTGCSCSSNEDVTTGSRLANLSFQCPFSSMRLHRNRFLSRNQQMTRSPLHQASQIHLTRPLNLVSLPPLHNSKQQLSQQANIMPGSSMILLCTLNSSTSQVLHRESPNKVHAVSERAEPRQIWGRMRHLEVLTSVL